ncbi:MAG: tyrosine-type recombinase/integrase [Sulfuriferula sp.]
MAKISFTAPKVLNFNCENGKSRSFLWDSDAPGLGLRVTDTGAKSYIFQARLNDQVIRITIGSPDAWLLPAARAEARRMKVMMDGGLDPRQVKADSLAAAQFEREAKDAEKAVLVVKEVRESVTVGMAWTEYITERTPRWSIRHALDHERIMQAGGRQRMRSPKLTEPGPLAVFANIRLIDLTNAHVETWAQAESLIRPTRARLALRLLKAFMNWCADHTLYKTIVVSNPAKSKKARECLGKAGVKNDVLQREQLPVWFAAVQSIGNPVINAYLQALLITGARREELANLRWDNVDFKWNSLRLHDKVEDFRMVPLTPYVSYLLSGLQRRNDWVFSSPTSQSGRLAEPRLAHNDALLAADLPHLTLHGLRRSFASLCEWTETPAGVAAQIQGHAPQGVREQNYIRRPLDLLRMWHIKIEAWILEQAQIEFSGVPIKPDLQVVKG